MNENIKSILRSDLMLIRGGKNRTITLYLICIIFFTLVGFFVTPLMGLYIPLAIAGFSVPMLFTNERKYHSDKMWGVLPVDRKDLVKARYILAVGTYLAMFIISYIIMLIAFVIKANRLVFGDDAENIDIIALLVKMLNGSLTEFGFFNLLYLIFNSIGLSICTSSLRKYFKNAEAFDAAISMEKVRISKRDILILIGVAAFIVLWAFIVSGLIPMGKLLPLIIEFVVKLADTGDGLLLGIVATIYAVMRAVYCYVCTQLEYGAKEI